MFVPNIIECFKFRVKMTMHSNIVITMTLYAPTPKEAITLFKRAKRSITKKWVLESVELLQVDGSWMSISDMDYSPESYQKAKEEVLNTAFASVYEAIDRL